MIPIKYRVTVKGTGHEYRCYTETIDAAQFVAHAVNSKYDCMATIVPIDPNGKEPSQ